MRSSKSRSRSKQNRPRSIGNIVNRVFDSSGPEGKVRGTPQQIIEKYQTLARDAQLSNDRVAAENFSQHAEHYTRMLGEAMREMAAEQDQRRPQQGSNGNGHPQQGGQGYAPRRDDRDDDQPDIGPVPVFGFGADGDEPDSGLVETPEARQDPPPRPAPQAQPRNERREPRQSDERRGDGRQGDGRQADTPRPPRPDQPRGDQPRQDQARDGQPRGDQPRGDQPRDGQPRGDQPRRDRDDRRREDRPRRDTPRPVADTPVSAAGAPGVAAPVDGAAVVHQLPVIEPRIAPQPAPVVLPAADPAPVAAPEAEAKPRRARAPRKPKDATPPTGDDSPTSE